MRPLGIKTVTARAVVLPMLLALVLPVIALADVAATVTVLKRQVQAGKVIRVTAVVEAHEQLTVDGRGRVRVGGRAYALAPKATSELSPTGAFALKLIPKPRVAGLIAEALNEGRRPPARITVILASAGSVETTQYRVRLTR